VAGAARRKARRNLEKAASKLDVDGIDCGVACLSSKDIAFKPQWNSLYMEPRCAEY
jgi:hypothetical protein